MLKELITQCIMIAINSKLIRIIVYMALPDYFKLHLVIPFIELERKVN